ncbi:MAG: RNA-binding protein, partial [Nitrospinota bacterium]|nr:RNA-binding protein [Nitrospinota bacterium]
MKNKLYVGNLPYSMKEEDLMDFFSEAGAVQSAKVITDMSTGRSKGFGFVEMETDEGAEKAIEIINGKELQGRSIRVDLAKEKEKGAPRGGGRDRDRDR